MKKILISVLIVLLLVTVCFAIFKGISFLKIKSFNDIKQESYNLDSNIEDAKTLATQEYPAQIESVDEAIKKLKLAKQEYENKIKYSTDNINIGAVEVKTYKIHYLWTILGNYAKEEGVRSMNLDLKTTTTKNVYNLQFTLVGNYVSITDFLYDIEDDEELKFQIKDLKIERTDSKVATTDAATNTTTNTIGVNSQSGNTTSKNTTNTTKQSADASDGGILLKQTFTVENVGISLD